jgi:hypothetical protein
MTERIDHPTPQPMKRAKRGRFQWSGAREQAVKS